MTDLCSSRECARRRAGCAIRCSGYHLFILTRIKEARDRGLESRAAVAKGISVTAGVITSAASIMVVVFAVFVTLKFVFIQPLGLGLAVAVLIDATIIRSVLLPASCCRRP